jgi:hypothetical protein
MKRFFISYFILILFFVACAKHETIEQDTVKPKIEVVYPLDNPTIRSGDPVCMKVLISDNKSLMSVWLQIGDGTGFKKDYSIPGRSLDIVEKYIVPAGIGGNFTATYFAVDEVGNMSSQEIKFAINN